MRLHYFVLALFQLTGLVILVVGFFQSSIYSRFYFLGLAFLVAIGAPAIIEEIEIKPSRRGEGRRGD